MLQSYNDYLSYLKIRINQMRFAVKNYNELPAIVRKKELSYYKNELLLIRNELKQFKKLHRLEV